MKDAILAPALANASQLISAPSLGCLNTYISAFTDLCRAYGIAVPDLKGVLQHIPMTTTTPSANRSKIKREYEESELDQVKRELPDEYPSTLQMKHVAAQPWVPLLQTQGGVDTIPKHLADETGSSSALGTFVTGPRRGRHTKHFTYQIRITSARGTSLTESCF